ncbi:MAG: gliding motility-associated C-terminal domain-containing protein [Chitinophagales bacterium]|nr:gliding motility-associated C-terminal domain-containing protein [Chitinophagales bacterium]
MKNTILFLLFNSLSLLLSAQICAPETNFWYFGINAGLDFSSGSPVPVTDGQLNVYEGTATMSDANGNLLFYTDGVQVYNRNHQLMPNGIGLTGNESTTQSALIIKQPDNDNIYFIFTAPSQGGSPMEAPAGMGIAYTVVDMLLDGGNGDVVSANNPLYYPAAEKLTVVRHANGCDYWVIGHAMGSSRYVSYLVSGSGVENVPVSSFVGDSYDVLDEEYVGYLKASPDGSKIANMKYPDAIEVFNFNRNTGQLSLLYTLPQPGFPAMFGYGVEFSPDGSKIYGAFGAGVLDFECLFQWDLTGGNASAVLNSKTPLFIYNPNINGFDSPKALQLALDGKIYVAFNGSNIGAINNPNAAGTACNFVPDAITLPTGTSCGNGLPNFAPFYFAPNPPVIAGNINVCPQETQNYSVNSCDDATYEWIYNGPNTIVAQTPEFVNILFGNNFGTDTLILHKFNCTNTYDTLLINVNQCQATDCTLLFNWSAIDTIVCQGETAYAFFQTNAIETYLHNHTTNGIDTLDFGDTNLSFDNLTASTCFSLYLLDPGCIDTIDFCVNVNPPLTLTINNELLDVCEGETASFDFLTNATTVQLIDLATGEITENPSSPITFNNVVADKCYNLFLSNGCDTSYNFCVHVKGQNTQTDTTIQICSGESVTINNNTYTESGSYIQNLSGAGDCDSTLTVHLTVLQADTLEQDIQLCLGESYSVGNNTYTQNGIYTDLLTNQNNCDSLVITHLSFTEFLTRSQSFSFCKGDSLLVNDNYLSEAGTYNDTLTFANTCDSLIITTIFLQPCDTFNISSCKLIFPNAFTPNGDDINDSFGAIAPCNDATDYNLVIYNRWGKLVYSTQTPADRWNGTLNNQPLPMDTYVWYATYKQTENDFDREHFDRGNITLVR